MHIVVVPPTVKQGRVHQIAPAELDLSAVTSTAKIVQRAKPATVSITAVVGQHKIHQVPSVGVTLTGVAPIQDARFKVPPVTISVYPTWPNQGNAGVFSVPPAVVEIGTTAPNNINVISLGSIDIPISVTISQPTIGAKTYFDLIDIPVRVGVSGLLSNADDPLDTSYRVIVVDQAGNMFAELDNAVPKPIKWAVANFETFEFDIPMGDAKASWCQALINEVQVYRGTKLLFWGPIIRTRDDASTLNVQCQDTSYYFTRRVFGRVPKGNLLNNAAADGPAGGWGWEYTSLPRSSPRRIPAHSYSFDHTYNTHRSLYMSSSIGKTTKTYANDTMFTGSALTSAGKTSLNAAIADTLGPNPIFTVHVYDDNSLKKDDSIKRARARSDAIADYILSQVPRATVNTDPDAYRHRLVKNDTASNRKTNRRTTITYRDDDGKKGGKQIARQVHKVSNPKPSDRKRTYTFSAYCYVQNAAGYAAGNRGMELVRSDPTVKHPDPKWRKEGYKKPLQTAMVPIGKGTPKGAWVRMEATVTVPNDGKQSIIEARMYTPNGDIYWSEIWLTYDESLYFKDREQGDILRQIIAHAQDESLGKSNLNIKTSIADTGVTRSREYLYEDRGTIYDALNEWQTLADGVEWDIRCTPTSRTFTTYFPRKGRDTDVILANDSNLAGYTIDLDGTQISTTVIVQADGKGSDREERAAVDPTLTGGLVLEYVYSITPNSPASSWQAQAARGLARYRRPVIIPSVILNPAYTTEFLNTVEVGDRVTTMIKDAWIDTAQKYRVTEMTLDPATDSLTYSLYPEDIGVEARLSYGSKGWKYLSKAQTGVTKRPVQSNVEYAAPDFDDSGWDTGEAGIGWVKASTGSKVQLEARTPKTEVPKGHEVWIRKHFKATGDVTLAVRGSDWSFLYVNGHLIDGNMGSYRQMTNHNTIGTGLVVNIPFEYLNPNGDQVVALHCQYDPDRYASSDLDSVYADVYVVGTYDEGLIL